MRLIDADALKTWFDNHYDHEEFSVGYISGLINEQPTIEAVTERKKGRWIYADDCDNLYDSYWCSNCHHGITVDAERRCDIGFVIEDLKFCPNCGAHMGGEQGDND